MTHEIRWSGVLVALGCAIGSIGLFALAMGGWLYRRESQRQSSWTPVTAEVLGREVVRRTGRAGTSSRNITYETQFTVRYQVSGQTLTSRVGIGYGSSRRSVMDQWAERFPNGTPLLLKYNPRNPVQLMFSDRQAGMAYSGPKSLAMWGGIILGIGAIVWTGGKMAAVTPQRF